MQRMTAHCGLFQKKNIMGNSTKKSLFTTILKAWLLAGTLDISCAFIQTYLKFQKGPSAVLKFIASGAFGKAAFSGGTEMSVYGLLFHYLIAFVWTIIFFLIYPKISFLQKNIFLTAILYGLFVWAIMNRVVLPLSAAPSIKFDLSKALVAALILMAAIGLPLSIMAKKYYGVNNA